MRISVVNLGFQKIQSRAFAAGMVLWYQAVNLSITKTGAVNAARLSLSRRKRKSGYSVAKPVARNGGQNTPTGSTA